MIKTTSQRKIEMSERDKETEINTINANIMKKNLIRKKDLH